MIDPRTQSYIFCIYNYNPNVAVGRPERFLEVVENIFVFNMHYVCMYVCTYVCM
jgi:hypothetical protein